MMNFGKKFAVGVASVALVASMGAMAPAAVAEGTDTSANRWAGADRYETAVAVAKKAFEHAGTVYVARGDVLADAVTGGVLKDGPLLLVSDDEKVQNRVADAVKDLSASKVVVLGGTDAVSDEVAKKVAGSAVIERVSGKDRFETSVKIAERAIKSNEELKKHVYLANGLTMVDALVGGQLNDGVMLLTNGADKLPDSVARKLNELGSVALTALGGKEAVSDELLRSAAVSQTILVKTFVEDNQAAVKASAQADLKVNGWVKAGPGVKESDVNEKLGTLEKAKVHATWPKVDASLALNPGEFYLGVDKDKKLSKVPLASVEKTADGKKDGAEAFGFKGTKLVATEATMFAANAKNKAAGELKKFFYGDSKADQSGKYVLDGKLKDDGNKEALKTVKAVFPKVDDKMTVKDWFASLGVYDMAKNKDVFDSAVDAQVGVLQSEAVKAVQANNDAVKAQKDAQGALDKLVMGHAVNTAFDRLAGEDRFGTAVAIAKKLYGEKGEKATSKLFFANGEAFADAAVAGYVDNSTNGGPVLLMKKDSVPGSTASWAAEADKTVDYQRSNVLALGGNAVVEDAALLAELDKLAPTSAASGTVSFGAPYVTATEVRVPVTTKDMPNGSTLKLVWEARTKGNKAAKELKLGANGGFNVTELGAYLVNNEATLKLTAPADASVRLVVKALTQNGTEITTTRSAWMDLK